MSIQSESWKSPDDYRANLANSLSIYQMQKEGGDSVVADPYQV
jgi:hypothetical protein